MNKGKQYIGLDLGGTSLKYGFGSSSSGLCGYDHSPVTDKTRSGVFELISDTITKILSNSNSGSSIAAIALGSPGIIDCHKGLVLSNCPNLPEWEGANPKEYLEREFSLPVFVENDANLAAYSESLLPERENKSILFITIGTGIGSGFVISGEIYRGGSYAAMELGHTVAVPGGENCLCGKKGCLERYSSVTAIMDSAKKTLSGSNCNSLTEILMQSRKDSHLADILKLAYSYLGQAIANTTVVLNPDIILIGGGITEALDFNLQPLELSIRSFLNPYYNKGVGVSVASWKNSAAVWGGINLAENRLHLS